MDFQKIFWVREKTKGEGGGVQKYRKYDILETYDDCKKIITLYDGQKIIFW